MGDSQRGKKGPWIRELRAESISSPEYGTETVIFVRYAQRKCNMK